MSGAVEETAKLAGGFMDALKREPLSLALVVMNLCLLVFFYVILVRVADQRKEEIGLLYADKKDVRNLLAKCVVPAMPQRSSGLTLGAHDGQPETPSSIIKNSPLFKDWGKQ